MSTFFTDSYALLTIVPLNFAVQCTLVDDCHNNFLVLILQFEAHLTSRLYFMSNSLWRIPMLMQSDSQFSFTDPLIVRGECSPCAKLKRSFRFVWRSIYMLARRWENLVSDGILGEMLFIHQAIMWQAITVSRKGAREIWLRKYGICQSNKGQMHFWDFFFLLSYYYDIC